MDHSAVDDQAEAPQFAKLRPLVDSGSGDFESVLRQVARQLHEAGVKGKLHVRVLTGNEEWQSARMLLSNRGGEVVTKSTGRSDLEILTDQETLNAVIEGKLSPIDAMAKRRMRLRGNVRLGSAILKRLAGSAGRTEICRSE
jgi:hypothetical protein